MTTVETGGEVGASVLAAGIATNYHDRGTGDPVLLIHGSGPGVSAWANWRLTLPVLAERYRMIAPDIVGFGYTAAPPGFAYGRESWSAHLLAFLDALGLSRVSVVGNSFGGALALSLAVEHPDRVAKLVLMGSVGVSFPLTPGLDQVWGFEPSVPGMRRLMELFVHDPSGLRDGLAEMRYRAATRPGIAEAFAAMFPAPRQRWIDALALDEASIRGIPHETLVVHGRDDRVIPLATSLRLSGLIDRSDLHVFGRCGHWVQIEAHERFTRLVGDFLATG